MKRENGNMFPKSNTRTSWSKERTLHFHKLLQRTLKQARGQDFTDQPQILYLFSSISSVITTFLSWKGYQHIFRGASKISGNTVFTCPEIILTHFSPCSFHFNNHPKGLNLQCFKDLCCKITSAPFQRNLVRKKREKST